MNQKPPPQDTDRVWTWAFHEDNVFHNRLRIFLTGHALLLAAVGFVLRNDSPRGFFLITVSSLGIILGLSWLLIQMRSGKIVKCLENRLESDRLFKEITDSLKTYVPY